MFQPNFEHTMRYVVTGGMALFIKYFYLRSNSDIQTAVAYRNSDIQILLSYWVLR